MNTFKVDLDALAKYKTQLFASIGDSVKATILNVSWTGSVVTKDLVIQVTLGFHQGEDYREVIDRLKLYSDSFIQKSAIDRKEQLQALAPSSGVKSLEGLEVLVTLKHVEGKGVFVTKYERAGI